MPVSQSVSQQIASLIALFSVAIIGVAVLLIPQSWKGFENTSCFLTSIEKRFIKKTLAFIFIPVLLLSLIVDVTGAYIPALTIPVGRSLLLTILLIIISFSLVSKVIKSRQKAKRSPEEGHLSLGYRTTLPLMYRITLCCVVLCIFFCLIALFGIVQVALNIDITPFDPANYNWAKWALLDGVAFFVLGFLSFSLTYFAKPKPTRKPADKIVKKRPIVQRAILLIILGLLIVSIWSMVKQVNYDPYLFIKAFLSMPLNVKTQINFTGTQFMITNESDFDWKNITFSINKQELSSGYTLTYESLKQGETLRVDASEFANSDGTRFDIATIRPSRISIDVYNSLGQIGTYSGYKILDKSQYSVTSMLLSVKTQVNFTGTQFIIKNESDFDWKNITFSINKQGLSSGYSLTRDSLKKGESLTVDATEFVDDNGIKFDPKTIKPTQFTIDVYNSTGQFGIYSGAFK